MNEQQTPIILSVIVPHQLEKNEMYLDLTLKSVAKAVEYFEMATGGARAEVFCLSPYAVTLQMQYPGVTFIQDSNLDNATKKINFAVSNMAPTSQAFCLISDDVYISENCLADLYRAAFHEDVKNPGTFYLSVVNPLSNQDIGTKIAPLPPVAISERGRPNGFHILGPDQSYEEGKSVFWSLVKWVQNPPVHFLQAWVPMFCTFVPKKIWTQLGGFDLKLETRHNDEDFCIRVRQAGYSILLSTGSFAYHFGTRTLRAAHKPEEFEEATKHFQEKWKDLPMF